MRRFFFAMKPILYFILTKSIGLYINILQWFAPKTAAKTAYNFFSHPRVKRLSQIDLPPILQSAEKQVFDFENHKIQTYIWAGSEETILLIHGWESNAARWENMVHLLQKHHKNIIAIDAPAHGLSSGKSFDIPTYGKFIRFISKKIQPQFIIAHSLGGASAVYSQAVFPSVSLQKMVLIAAPADQKVLFEKYVKLLSLNNSVLIGIDKYFEKRFGYSLDEFSGRNFAKLITIPTLIIHDHTDTSVLYEESQKILSNLPDSIMHSTNGLDHSMQDDDLSQLIYNFLFL